MATTKKSIRPEKKWWTKNLEKMDAVLAAAGLAGKHEYAFKGILGDINLIFMKYSVEGKYIRRSVIMNDLQRRGKRKNKMFNTVLENKWLFYRRLIEMGRDELLQPIFNMETISESKVNDILKAMTNDNYEKVKKLVPNILDDYNEYSRSLFSEENTKDTGFSDSGLLSSFDQPNPTCDRSDLASTNSEDEPTKCSPIERPIEQGPIIRTHAEEIERKKENRELDIEGRKDTGTIVGETEPNPSVPRYQKTELDVISKERDWKEYLANLKVDSKEMQALLNYAGEDREMIENNFELFKFHLLNRTKFRKKDEYEPTKSDAGKNEYIYCLLKDVPERRRLVKQIQDSIEARRKRDTTYGKPGFPYDFFNKQGQRISGRRIVPDDAPPRPTAEHFWNCGWVHDPPLQVYRTLQVTNRSEHSEDTYRSGRTTAEGRPYRGGAI